MNVTYFPKYYFVQKCNLCPQHLTKTTKYFVPKNSNYFVWIEHGKGPC